MKRLIPLVIVACGAAALAQENPRGGKSADECRQEAETVPATDRDAAVIECLLSNAAPVAPEAAATPRAKRIVSKPTAALASRAKAAVRERLRDPSSASYSDLYTVRLAHAGQSELTVCGLVNARNGFGGYAGRMLFAYHFDGAGGSAVLESEDAALVVELCSTK